MPNEKCGKCELVIDQQKNIIKCTDCSSPFHLTCVSGENSKRVTRNSYKCEGCASENSSTSSRMAQDRDSAAILDAIAALRQDTSESFAVLRRENSEMWRQTQSKLDKVEDDLKNVTADLCVVKRQYDEVKEKVTMTDVNIEKLQEDNLDLQTKIQDLKAEIEEMQQYSRIDNIVITGVPMLKGEDIFMILADIAKALRIKFNRYDVSAAHRLSNKMSQGRPPAIVVKFATRTIKSDWMYARKNKGTLKANELHHIFPDSSVFFNDHLTVHSRNVFNLGRQMVKDKHLAYIWVKDGRILAKQSEFGKTIRVRSELDLERIRRSASSPAAPNDVDCMAAAPGAAVSTRPEIAALPAAAPEVVPSTITYAKKLSTPSKTGLPTA